MEDSENLTRHQILMHQRQYQDRLFWSRVQTLYVVQAAVLGGGFALQHEWYGWAILLLGSTLTTLIGLLCSYDWQGVKVNEVQFYSLCDLLDIRWDAKHVGIRKLLPGNRILKWTIVGFIWLDVGLGATFFWNVNEWEVIAKSIALAAVFILLVGWSIYFHGFWNRPVQKPDPVPRNLKNAT